MRAFVSLLLTCVAIHAFADDLAGHWDATLRHESDQWHLAIDVDAQTDSATVDFVDLGTYGIPFKMSRSADRVLLQRDQPGGRPITIDLEVRAERMHGTFTGLGLTAAIDGHPSAAPPSFRQEEVAFRNGEVSLSGTILLPAEKPVAGIVIVHGSGPVDRSMASYHSDGVFCARLGLVTLIYDKRGTGGSTGDFNTASMEDLAGDAIAGARLLEQRFSVPVGISGVSQGGWIGPLAATRGHLAFVIATSPASINPMEQSIFNTENVLRNAGYGADIIERATRLRRRMYAWVRTGVDDKKLAGDLEAVHEKPWFAKSALPYPLSATVSPGERKLLMFEPLPVWRRLEVPVLVFWGGADIQVPSRRSQREIEAALRHNSDHTLVMYPKADHNLVLPRPPNTLPRTATGFRTLEAEWLRERFGSW